MTLIISTKQKAEAISVSQFELGFAMGAACCMMWATFLHLAVSVGEDLYRLQSGIAVETVKRDE